MNPCPSCGAPLNPQGRFCGRCGTPVPAPEPTADLARPVSADTAVAPPAVPAATSTPSVQEPIELRDDVRAGLHLVPAEVGAHIVSRASVPLRMLSENLPGDEAVEVITGGSSQVVGGSLDGIVAITSHRLLFVGPQPLVLTLALHRITRVYLDSDRAPVRYFLVEEGTLEAKMGIEGSWAEEFKRRLDVAVARARLAVR
jgi:hypothetical protein